MVLRGRWDWRDSGYAVPCGTGHPEREQRRPAAGGARPEARPAPGGTGDAMTVAVRVIPCLDVDAGRVVKGVNFRDLRDAGDPVELAAAYDAEGADELVFLDITASSGDRETMIDVVGRTADQVFIPLTVGGGVRSVADVDRLLRAGADKVSLNTAAIARPELLAEAAQRFGSQCVVLSVDARRIPAGDTGGSAAGGLPRQAPGDHRPGPARFEVTTHGGRRGTGIDAAMYARKIEVVCRGLARHRPDRADPVGVIAAFGGFEHAALAGFILGAAALRVPVILDGVIAGAAALAAAALAPDAIAACFAGHRSAEPGHAVTLSYLGLRPLVDLGLRLGEGTGAVLALPLVQSAARALRDVATFDSAGVADKT